MELIYTVKRKLECPLSREVRMSLFKRRLFGHRHGTSAARDGRLEA